jgi:hypothetical protein
MSNWKLQGVSVVEDATGAVESVEGSVPGPGLFDPAEHTIDQVKAYVNDHLDDAQRVYDAELDGKARATLLAWLTGE